VAGNGCDGDEGAAARVGARRRSRSCTQFADGGFDAVLDKGALDALMGEPGTESERQGGALLAECCRVLAPGGSVVIVSLLQEHVAALLLRTFRAGWALSIAQVPASPDMFVSPLQPFLVTARKAAEPPCTASPPAAVQLRSLPGVTVNAEQARCVRALVARENAGRAAPAGALPPSATASATVGDPYIALHPGRSLTQSLAGRRFSATVVDAVADGSSETPASGPRPPQREAAVFLVPQGREHEWLFGSDPGRLHLASSCGVRRLVVISLGRGCAFGSSEAVQSELSPLVLPLLPAASRAAPRGAVPILSTAEGLGERRQVASVESPLSGTLLVEDVTFPAEDGDGDGSGSVTLRRLIFAAQPNLIQSEARMRFDGGAAAADHSHLSCEYQAAIVAGLAVAAPALMAARLGDDCASPRPRVCVIGLGGGGLPCFLATHFAVHVTAVELDPAVAQLAADTFGFSPGPALALHVGDGLAYVASLPPASLDALVVDAGSNDASLAMSCPPPAFLERPFLAAAAAALRPGGCLAVNCVARGSDSFALARGALRAVFPVVLAADSMADDVNQVYFARAEAPAVYGAEAASALRAARTRGWDPETNIEELVLGVREIRDDGLAGELD
jgi:precorrin-6B methylase 2